MGEAVAVGMGVEVAVAVAVGLGVGVGLAVAVGVGVGVGLAVAVGVGVGVGLAVAVGVGVGVGVAVTVGMGVGVSVAVSVAVGVGVRVAVGLGRTFAAGSSEQPARSMPMSRTLETIQDCNGLDISTPISKVSFPWSPVRESFTSRVGRIAERNLLYLGHSRDSFCRAVHSVVLKALATWSSPEEKPSQVANNRTYRVGHCCQ